MGKETNVIDETMKKYKRRMKQLCCCGTVWTLLGIVSLIVGILMLVYFLKYWNDDDNWRRGLAYFGVILLIVFIVTLAIGIVFFVILKKIYDRMDSPDRGMKMFKPPNYAYGEAPYPQQPPDTPAGSPTKQPLQPGGTEPSAPPAGNVQDVNIEISDHSKF